MFLRQLRADHSACASVDQRDLNRSWLPDFPVSSRAFSPLRLVYQSVLNYPSA
jgi:hypothetical protein